MEEVNTRRPIFVSLSNLGCGLQEINSRKFYIATKFENWTRIHFKQ